MSEQQEVKKPFRQFFYRGKEVETLVDTPREELMELLHARARRRFKRGNNLDAYEHFLARLRKAKARAAGGRPDFVKTHLRNAIVLPEMVGSNVGIYNGFGFHPVEIKPNMVGHYLGEFSLTYTPVQHGKTGKESNISKYLPK